MKMSHYNIKNDSKASFLQNDKKFENFQTNYERILHAIDEKYTHSVCFKESLNILSEKNTTIGKFLVDIDTDKDSCGITYLVFLSLEEKVNGVDHCSTISSRINTQFITLEEKRLDSLQFGYKKIESELYLLNEGDFYNAAISSFDGKDWKRDDLEIPIEGSTVLLGEGASYLYLRYLAQSGTRKSANFLVLLNDGSLHISEYVSRYMGKERVGRNKKKIETMSVKKLVHNRGEQQTTEWTLIKGSGYILEEKRKIPLGTLNLPGYHEEEEHKSEEQEEDFDDEEFRALLKDKPVETEEEDKSFIEKEETIPEIDTYYEDGVVIVEIDEEDEGSQEEIISKGLSEGELLIIEETITEPSDSDDGGNDIEDLDSVVFEEVVDEDTRSREEIPLEVLSEREIPLIAKRTSERGSKEIPLKVLSEREMPLIAKRTSKRGSKEFEAYQTEITEEYVDEERSLKPESKKKETLRKKEVKYNLEVVEGFETEKSPFIDDEAIKRDRKGTGENSDRAIILDEVIEGAGTREEVPLEELPKIKIPLIKVTTPDGRVIVDTGEDVDRVIIIDKAEEDVGSREDVPLEELPKRKISVIKVTNSYGRDNEEIGEDVDVGPIVELAEEDEGGQEDIEGDVDAAIITDEVEEDARNREGIPSKGLSEGELPITKEKTSGISDSKDKEKNIEDVEAVTIVEIVEEDTGSWEEISLEELSARELPLIMEIYSEQRDTEDIGEDVDSEAIIEIVEEDERSREDIGEDVEDVEAVIVEVVERYAGSRQEIPTEITEEYFEEREVLKPEGKEERLYAGEGIIELEHEKTPMDSFLTEEELKVAEEIEPTSEPDVGDIQVGEERKKVGFLEEEKESEVGEGEEEEEEEGEGEEEEEDEEKEEGGEEEVDEVPEEEEEPEGEGSDVGEEERGEIEEEEDVGEGEGEGAGEEGEIGEGGGKFGEGGERGEGESEVEDMREALEKRKQLEYARYVWPDMTEEESEEELKLEDILADVGRLQEECKKIRRHIRGMVIQGEEWRLKWRGSTIMKEPLNWSIVEGERRIAVHKNCFVMDDGKVDQSPVPLEYRWREDPELMSAYRNRKVRRKMDIRSYLAKHEEIRHMMSDFLLHIFLQKPENVINFSVEYFKTFNPK